MRRLLANKEYQVLSSLRTLGGVATRKDIASIVDINENQISTYLSTLRRLGFIKRTGRRRIYNDRGTSVVEYSLKEISKNA